MDVVDEAKELAVVSDDVHGRPVDGPASGDVVSASAAAFYGSPGE